MGKINYNADQVKSVFENNPTEDSIIITSDGNVFLPKHKSYAKNHCNEFKQEFEELTRAQFEAESTGGKSKTSKEPASGLTAWQEGKFGEIVEFAKSKGLEAKTTKTQGTKKLIIEVETFLATLPPVEKVEDSAASKEGEEGADYKVVGAGAEGSQE